MDAQDLVSGGYREFHDPMAADKLGSWYRSSYQKRTTDERGTRYFITITSGVRPAVNNQPSAVFFVVENQFTHHGTVFNVEMLHHHETLEQVEEFFAKLWLTMKLDYYEMREG